MQVRDWIGRPESLGATLDKLSPSFKGSQVSVMQIVNKIGLLLYSHALVKWSNGWKACFLKHFLIILTPHILGQHARQNWDMIHAVVKYILHNSGEKKSIQHVYVIILIDK